MFVQRNNGAVGFAALVLRLAKQYLVVHIHVPHTYPIHSVNTAAIYHATKQHKKPTLGKCAVKVKLARAEKLDSRRLSTRGTREIEYQLDAFRLLPTHIAREDFVWKAFDWPREGVHVVRFGLVPAVLAIEDDGQDPGRQSIRASFSAK